jgi:lysozyme
LRALFMLVFASALAACGAPAPQPRIESSAPATLRFVDARPHDWVDRTPWSYAIHGIDVSRWQGEIDWRRVRTSGASFAFIKATEGGDVVDPMFAANWAAARSAGIPRGAYHFWYHCRSAIEQARWFIKHVPAEPGALPPVLDIEWNHLSRTCPLRPDAARVRAEMGVFIGAISRHYGKKPVIYVTPDFYRDNDLGRIAGGRFWLRSVAGHPEIVYPGQSWTFWQYTGTGLVPGIEGHTDINVFAGNHAQWRTWLAGNML